MCTACQKAAVGRKKGKKIMKRRRRSIRGFSSGNIQSALTNQVLPGVLGAVAANYLDKIPGLSSNPQYTNYAGLLGGVLLATMTKNQMLQAAGVGMAIVSGKNIANDLLDGQPGVNLLAPGQRSYNIGEYSAPNVAVL